MFAELNKDVEDILTISDFKTLVIKVIHRRYNAGEAAKIFELLEDGSGGSRKLLNISPQERSRGRA